MSSDSAKVVAMDESGSRFLCPVDGCTSSFRRKEHLTRHSKSHNSQTSSFTCSVCSRKFNRSDSLHRHLARHGESFKPSSSRSKAACFACHAAKIKCDGDRQCHNCAKKGVECKYRSADVDPVPQLDVGVGQLDVSDSGVSMNDSSPEANGTPPNSQPDGAPPPIFPMPRSEEFINWASVRIQKDDEPIERYSTPNLDLYFTHIHHRFPIIHRPSYIANTKGRTLELLKSSMEMIGALLQGSDQSRKLAFELHQKSIAECLFEISNISSLDVYQQSFPAGLCQAVLLNVVFVLYCGKTSLVSRGLFLYNMLIAALREVGFFNPHTIWSDEKPGVFLPFHLLKMGERQMLAETLYKIDAYLSFARGHAPIISPEELIFLVPSSFSIWNSNGLDAWEERLGKQPIFRMERTIYEMINSTAESNEMIKSHLLWEDIQLCLCSMQNRLWRLHTLARNTSSESATDTTACQEILKRQIDHLKLQIDQMAFCPSLSAHYYGFEDHTSPDSKPIIDARSDTLRFDTIILYHLVSIHLYGDINGLTHVAKEFSLDLTKYSEHQQNSIGNRRCDKAIRLSTPYFRRSLCHAVDILSEFQLLDTKPTEQKIGIDPIAYVALSTAALIVWTHISFGLYSCEACSVGLGFDFPDTIVELGPSIQSPCVKEEWIEHGRIHKVAIDGVEICSCKLVPLLGKFQMFLPGNGWELAESIAPGVFGCQVVSKTAAV